MKDKTGVPGAPLSGKKGQPKTRPKKIKENRETDASFLLDFLDEELRRDFVHTSLALAEARRRQQDKDTPMQRRDVLACAARVDAVLDMYLMHLEIHRDPSMATGV